MYRFGLKRSDVLAAAKTPPLIVSTSKADPNVTVVPETVTATALAVVVEEK